MYRRIVCRTECIVFRDEPEAYVLALHARIGKGKQDDEAEGR